MTDVSGAIAFRRVVIRFCDTFGSATSLEVAAGFARTLQSELVGIFIEDEELMEWSSSRFSTRVPVSSPAPPEVPASGGRQEATAAAMNVRRRFVRVATSLGVRMRFEVERASAASLESAGAGQDDLLVVIEPADPLARQSYPFTSILEAVVRYPGPVLYVPRNVRPLSTSKVALAENASNAVGEIARDIAAKLGAKVISLDDIGHIQARRGEHLIVFDRQAFQSKRDFQFATIAAEHAAPALMVGTHSAS